MRSTPLPFASPPQRPFKFLTAATATQTGPNRTPLLHLKASYPLYSSPIHVFDSRDALLICEWSAALHLQTSLYAS